MPGAKLRITVLITQSGINSAKRLGAGSLFRFGSSLVEYSCFDCLQLPAATSLPTPPYKHHHSADFNLNSFSHIEFHTPSPPPFHPPTPTHTPTHPPTHSPHFSPTPCPYKIAQIMMRYTGPLTAMCALHRHYTAFLALNVFGTRPSHRQEYEIW